MNDTLKATRLDFALIKPYMKNICLTMAIPVAFAALNRSLMTGISFAMCFIAMTAGYTFSVSEKSGMDRLYGILPISKKNLVLGRYLYTCSMGLLAFLFSIIIHPIVLKALGETVQPVDICLAAILGILMFTLYTVFQLPGYYKFGSINGRIFMYIPVVGFLAILLFVSKLDVTSNPIFAALTGNPIISVIILVLVCIIAYLLSIILSIKIVQRKEV
ncbi:MAG: ABC-2 transporter permease [Lachnospiraceae bacterium]|nr:ABC-2 transporter permease [Lachnospiraceae bacterium]